MICEKKDCSGCFACYNVCPKKAIEMKEDDFGNIYPVIDEKKCVNCMLCQKTCPAINNNSKFVSSMDVYALYNRNNQKRLESSSGGAACLFYEYILDNNGIAYGVSNLFTDNFSFIRIEKKEDIMKLKGSKYVHCYINETYKLILKDLKNNKKVIFIGTPCQVDGLKNFLKKDYLNLYTIDIICHGVSSQKLLLDELKLQNIDFNKINKIYFRNSNLFVLKILDFDNKVLFEKQADKVSYYKNFLQGNTYRENCYSCRYARKERVSDITIGDYWGLSKESKIYDNDSDGISLVMINTNKGKELFNNIRKEAKYEKRDIKEAIKKNEQLNKPALKNKKYYIFRDNYKKIGYKKTNRKMLSFKEKIIFYIKNKPFLYNLLKKIKH